MEGNPSFGWEEARGLWNQVEGSPGYIPFLKTKTTEEIKAEKSRFFRGHMNYV